jgi:hypothetical protein
MREQGVGTRELRELGKNVILTSDSCTGGFSKQIDGFSEKFLVKTRPYDF